VNEVQSRFGSHGAQGVGEEICSVLSSLEILIVAEVSLERLDVAGNLLVMECHVSSHSSDQFGLVSKDLAPLFDGLDIATDVFACGYFSWDF
jgi:hypothetical protein